MRSLGPVWALVGSPQMLPRVPGGTWEHLGAPRGSWESLGAYAGTQEHLRTQGFMEFPRDPWAPKGLQEPLGAPRISIGPVGSKGLSGGPRWVPKALLGSLGFLRATGSAKEPPGHP